tara:strand:+ start:589 stop:981 length:393 start_codon:yes stop_codon:yes gene_type:complete
MAFGTLAFDTLSVSGVITGAVKSVDADYLATGAPKYWIQYNGSTNVTLGSLNSSSVTDNGTGDHSFAYTNVFPNTGYSCTGAHRSPGATGGLGANFDQAAGNTRYYQFTAANDGNFDATQISVTISGNLA